MRCLVTPCLVWFIFSEKCLPFIAAPGKVVWKKKKEQYIKVHCIRLYHRYHFHLENGLFLRQKEKRKKKGH